jgi:hypothetical protein
LFYQCRALSRHCGCFCCVAWRLPRPP